MTPIPQPQTPKIGSVGGTTAARDTVAPDAEFVIEIEIEIGAPRDMSGAARGVLA